ncbi:MAG: hypothetical protein EXR79_12250 [Myxococcales bacterium]|nr:hypothetical protein [Myxococcales bacterium]
MWGAAVHRVAVIGASKNAGKTTVLNALVAIASRRGETVGLVSVGRDGEDHDAWSGEPKPAVWVEKGTLVVTAGLFAAAAGARLRVLGDAGFRSALGRAVVCEARAPGAVELCGVPHRAALAQAVAALQAAGALLVAIDGAYHRQAAAHPAVADATVLAIGAILAAAPADMVRCALPTLRALTCPAANDGLAWDDLDGACTDAALDRLAGAGARRVRVETPGHILMHEAGWVRADRAGIDIAVRWAVPLIALATSPFRAPEPAADAIAVHASVVAAARALAWHGPCVDLVAGLVAAAEPQK